jgi:hypothetical protein
MNKHIRRSIVEGDEPETPLSIEKLHSTDRHYQLPTRARRAFRAESLRRFRQQLNYLAHSRHSIKNLHVEDWVPFLDCHASFFGSLIRLVRRLDLPIDLEVESALLGSLASPQVFMRWVVQVRHFVACVANGHPKVLVCRINVASSLNGV